MLIIESLGIKQLDSAPIFWQSPNTFASKSSNHPFTKMMRLSKAKDSPLHALKNFMSKISISE